MVDNYIIKQESNMAFKKFTPKNVRICPGCPPKNIETITGPKFTMTLPDEKKDTQVTSVKKPIPNANSRVRRGNQTTLF